MNASSRIYVAGHKGLVGSAIVNCLESKGYDQIITRSHADLDLTCQETVRTFFEDEKPAYVFLAAARVGGIHANDAFPADFIYQNLLIQANVIDAAYRSGVAKLLFLGSSCIYPKFASQPMKEAHLLTGELEPTNQWYAVAKIAGIKLCQAYRRQYGFKAISCMPTNLYGPRDNFDLKTSHVLPALIRKCHEAKAGAEDHILVWGSGTPRREFLYVDDLADACHFLMQNYDSEEIINVGVGEDVSISDLSELVSRVVGFEGAIVFDPSMPDGTPRKLLDISNLRALGWKPKIPLEEGIRKTYEWYLRAYEGSV